MYSVVIPTLWRSENFEESINNVLHHPLVGEVIVINNDEARTPQWFKELQTTKITYVNFKENIYVNPAWNHGVHISKYDKICLMNDDIVFFNHIFDFLYHKVDMLSGIIGMHKNCYEPADSDVLAIEDCHVLENGSGFGCLMFLDKRTYQPIPDMLKIYCGDDWIFYENLKKGLIPKVVKNLQIWGHIGLTSCEAIFDEIKFRDIEIYSRMKQNV